MITIGIDEIQKAVVSVLKANANLLAVLQSSSDIKEYQYQGETYNYPAIRVQVGVIKPDGEIQCGRWNVPFHILVFSEQKSSQECSHIAGIVEDMFHNHFYTVNGLQFVRIHVDGVIPPVRKDINSWRSEVNCHSLMGRHP